MDRQIAALVSDVDQLRLSIEQQTDLSNVAGRDRSSEARAFRRHVIALLPYRFEERNQLGVSAFPRDPDK